MGHEWGTWVGSRAPNPCTRNYRLERIPRSRAEQSLVRIVRSAVRTICGVLRVSLYALVSAVEMTHIAWIRSQRTPSGRSRRRAGVRLRPRAMLFKHGSRLAPERHSLFQGLEALGPAPLAIDLVSGPVALGTAALPSRMNAAPFRVPHFQPRVMFDLQPACGSHEPILARFAAQRAFLARRIAFVWLVRYQNPSLS